MNKPRIAIFDDDQSILDVIRIVLESDWTVYTYTNCEQICDTINIVQPQIIFIDNNISPSGGINATGELKSDERLKKIPVVYFSAHQNVDALAQMAGADHYLPKPFDIENLLSTLNSLISDR